MSVSPDSTGSRPWHLDRDAGERSRPRLLEHLAADPGTGVVLVDARGRVALAGPAVAADLPGDGLTPAHEAEPQGLRLAPVRAREVDVSGALCFYLGRLRPADAQPSGAPEPSPGTGPGTAAEAAHGAGAAQAWIAVVIPEPAPTPPTDAEGASRPHGPFEALLERYPLSALRAVAADLPAHEADLATAAVALAAWHARARYCTVCGSPTAPEQAGWAQRCRGCGDVSFPRTDPAVIMAVTDDADRLLLVHGATWAPGRYSVVAGFVEAGERAEDAVVREVREETGLAVGGVEHVTTQPWPFPRSLMLGYRARLLPGEHLPQPDGEEVTGALMVSREELAGLVGSGEVVLPGRASVARRLIEAWFGHGLPAAPAQAGL